MRRTLWNSLMCACVGFLIFSGAVASHAAANPQKQADRFLSATQKRDFKVLFEMSFFYQRGVQQIKNESPKSLWDVKIGNYYNALEKVYSGKIQEQGETQMSRNFSEGIGSITEPMGFIHSLTVMLAPGCTWKIEETRRETRVDNWDGRQYTVDNVYVGLAYKSVEDSPMVGSQVGPKLLKRTIVNIIFDTGSGQYLRSNRVNEGDAYWGGDAATNYRIAKVFAQKGQVNMSILIMEDLLKKGELPEEGKAVLAATYFESVKKQSFFLIGQKCYGLNANFAHKPMVQRAIALDENYKDLWVIMLTDAINFNVKNDLACNNGSGITDQLVSVANEFARGISHSEQKISLSVFDYASFWLKRAKESANRGVFEQASMDFKRARDLVKDDPRIKQSARETLLPFIREGANIVHQDNLKYSQPIVNQMGLMETVDVVGLTPEPEEKLIFAKSAKLAARGYTHQFLSGKPNRSRAEYWAAKANEWSEGLSAQEIKSIAETDQAGQAQTQERRNTPSQSQGQQKPQFPKSPSDLFKGLIKDRRK